MKNFFLDLAFSDTNAERITAVFNNGHADVEYTMDIFGLLCTDPTVEMIISAETGEVLFDRDED